MGRSIEFPYVSIFSSINVVKTLGFSNLCPFCSSVPTFSNGGSVGMGRSRPTDPPLEKTKEMGIDLKNIRFYNHHWKKYCISVRFHSFSINVVKTYGFTRIFQFSRFLFFPVGDPWAWIDPCPRIRHWKNSKTGTQWEQTCKT